MNTSVISIIGGLALAVGAGFAWRSLATRRTGISGRVALCAAVLGVLANTIYVGWAVADHGLVQTFRQGQEAALLLASLIAIVGIGSHLSATLGGLDGFLFLLAAVVDFAGLSQGKWDSDAPHYHSWYISHAMSFAASGACLMAAGIGGITYLVVLHILRRKRAMELVGRFPSLEALDRFSRWMLAIGFPIFSYGILTGLCGVAHRKDIGKTAWYLDPTVVCCVIAWCVYAWLCSSLVFWPRMRGRKAATLTTCGMALVALAFFFMEFLSPIHK
jgi:ABC-type uncharacterized transport system permease subunit